MRVHQPETIEMTVPAKSEFVGVVRLTVSGIANRLGYTYDDIEDIKIAVAEACTNVVDHAYDEGGTMGLSFHLYEDRMEVIVTDQGQSFDMDAFRESLGPIDGSKPIQDLREGGLGLFLINTLMDKVEMKEDSGVVLAMTKFLQRDEVDNRVEGISATQTEQR
ncbi:anti-sigma B factor RsbW [Halalkalibacterium halodurans]|uniref:anti-sigma B factor RsbW n=1 Tax=Halalkalibacterium halodurans TaxID=86665 RepID=UPI002E2150EA|nr:anti-sigma B factor RsbW [Halalkalibacterium halodurans]MED4161591.1 anti-sigma B factor RsbW [Halalkalibacterium halodurans]